METKKYEILKDDDITIDGHTLHRIKALVDLPSIKKGRLGGWIESEYNLSQDGDCFVIDYAKVYGYAKVHENAVIKDRAEVYNNAVIGGNAIIADNSRVADFAKVYGDAVIYGGADIGGLCEIRGEVKVHK